VQLPAGRKADYVPIQPITFRYRSGLLKRQFDHGGARCHSPHFCADLRRLEHDADETTSGRGYPAQPSVIGAA
jgi:hypothetical protein